MRRLHHQAEARAWIIRLSSFASTKKVVGGLKQSTVGVTHVLPVDSEDEVGAQVLDSPSMLQVIDWVQRFADEVPQVM